MALVMIFIIFLIIIGFPIGVFFVIRYFINYNAQLKNKKTQQEEEMDKMKIEDL